MTSQQRAMISPISTPPVRQPFALHRAKAVLGACLMAALVLALPACGRDPSASASDPAPPPAATAPDLSKTYHFESGPVRPLALSADRKRLFVANTAAGTLDILTVDDDGLQMPKPRCRSAWTPSRSPSAMPARSGWSTTCPTASAWSTWPARRHACARPCWWATSPATSSSPGRSARRAFHHHRTSRPAAHLARPGRGARRGRPAAHRRPASAAPTSGCSTPISLGDTLGGRPLAIVVLPGDTPRALATSADARHRYSSAVHHSGNRTTSHLLAPAVRRLRQRHPLHRQRPDRARLRAGPGHQSAPACQHPRVSVIVKADPRGAWRDARGRDWSSLVRFQSARRRCVRARRADPGHHQPIRAGGHHAVQHGGQPAHGHRLCVEHRGAQRPALRRAGALRRHHLAGALWPRRASRVLSARQGSRPATLNQHLDYDRRPAPPTLRSHSLVHAAGHGGIGRRRHAVRCRVRLRQGRRAAHRRRSQTDSFDPVALSAALT
jgi:hypothetical protein